MIMGNVKSKGGWKIKKKRKEKHLVCISKNYLLLLWTNEEKSVFDRQKIN